MYRQAVVAPPVTTRHEPRADSSRDGTVVDGAAEVSDASPRLRKPNRSLPPVELGPIIKSKIQPPALRTSTLSRPRLIDQLRHATSRRLTLLIAEAGYGKTTLLADFASQSGIRTLWYRLDSTDADIITWANHLIAAVRETEPTFGEATLRLMNELTTGGPPRSAFITSVIAELSAIDSGPTVLVLDDFQEVDTSEEVLEFVQRLLRDSPPWLSLVISCRRRPDLEVSRWRASGDVDEITTTDLRFSIDETIELFADKFQTPLENDVIRDLDERTKGWIASLQLFYGSIRGRPSSAIRPMARALSGASSPIYDFLAEEVLSSLPPDLELFLIRSSLLTTIDSISAASLLSDDEGGSTDAANRLIEEADRLALLSRSSTVGDAHELHPLLREFLLGQLQQRESSDAIREMHVRAARATAARDPLTAAHHYVEAAAYADAMKCLGASVMLTIGSGRWGVASQLLSRVAGLAADPAVATIRARQLLQEGELAEASALLNGIDVTDASAEVRAVFRHTMLSLGWRTGNREQMFRALEDIDADAETPPVIREMAELMLAASPFASPLKPLAVLAQRLRDMADTMANENLTFYSAVALHNSAIAYLNAGNFRAALEVGSEALERFSHLTFFALEQLSTHTVMAVCEEELGNDLSATAHRVAALSSGNEMADVPAELASLAVVTGDTDAASDLVLRAQGLQRQNQSDTVGDALLDCAISQMEFRTNLPRAVSRLTAVAFDGPLELGYSLERDVLLAQALLLSHDDDRAGDLIEKALGEATARGARRAQARLAILAVLIAGTRGPLAELDAAEQLGSLAILELADSLLDRIDLVLPIPAAMDRSIRRHPRRWLPAVRRAIQSGNTPKGRAAAALLEEYGAVEDVGLLRAYAKTYIRKGPGKSLGRRLARRTSPALRVLDLGPTRLAIGDRTVMATSIRRKAASVLMYLVTRPGFSANREQVVDELWPDADPDSAINNLNQSLYFLRREIDPWYEDDLSVDYVELQRDLVWLDRDLVSAESADFLAAAQRRAMDLSELSGVVHSYAGQFAPEFEYEEWAMAWRGTIHAVFLDSAHSVIDQLVRQDQLSFARDVAAHVLRVDPSATDIQVRLVWIYGRMGIVSAARSLYEQVERRDRADGVEPLPLAALLEGPLPLGR